MTVTAITAGKAKTPTDQFRHELGLMEPEFKHALPVHMPVERFMRVVITAVQRSPDLLVADRKSLFSSCMLCAQDGLLPDGREAALVIYNTKSKRDGKEIWEKRVQYIPMIAGIRKKVRNSDEIATWDARVVFANDHFEVVLGDNERIEHKPNIFNPGDPVAVYSIAVLKNGERSREVMTIAEVQAVRARSKAKDSGPWITDFNEMARKTVLRRHSKALPVSTDLDDLIRRDDALYDFEGRKDGAAALPAKPKTVQGMLDHFAGNEPQAEVEEADTTGSDEPKKKGKKKDAGGMRFEPELSASNLEVLLGSLDEPLSQDDLHELVAGAVSIVERMIPEHQNTAEAKLTERSMQILGDGTVPLTFFR